jgi:hypothetical protein
MAKRTRRIGSIKDELLNKSREATLSAVQIFNNPNITFKAETFIVLMNIAWTYLLHAYYRSINVDYRHYKAVGKRRKFNRTKNGAYKCWELERCLNEILSPIDKNTSNNLRFLIGIRHEIEHQMTTRIDDYLSARFQACCLNYNDYIKKLFGDKYGIEKYLSVSLQFSSLSEEQARTLDDLKGLPKNIYKFIEGFDGPLTDEEYNSPQYAYRVLFIAKTVNRKGQADQVIEFVKSDSKLAQKVNTDYAIVKETEKPKCRAGHVVEQMQSEGFLKFTMYQHTQLWKDLDAKNASKGYGVDVAGYWYWYERWVDTVRKHCLKHKARYK